jgi:hypothetical protein
MRMRLGRLDRLAVAAAGGFRREPMPIPEESPGRRYSRAHVVRLAVGGAAALSFGLAGGAAARSLETISQCVAGCASEYEKANNRDILMCENAVYGGHGDFSTWLGRYGRAIIYPPETARLAWSNACHVATSAARYVQRDACRSNCLDKCAQSPQDCSPTAPPTSAAPAAPPAPSPDGVPANCKNCPGVCCPCGSASGFSCATYVPHGPGATQGCDVCKRNCVGSC